CVRQLRLRYFDYW
nr:immunoglobulin heavy chain junction region [Mus musculus]MBK4187543.1 immunoglobulin heavy chain junction region [Mus musculus]